MGWWHSLIETLSNTPNWVWLVVVAFITHRLSLRRESWNREQARRTEQRQVVADFSAAVTALGSAGGNVATWAQRAQQAMRDGDDDETILKFDAVLETFSDKVFDAHRAMDLLKMTLVQPQLVYRATFALKLCQEITELGGHRKSDPELQNWTLDLLIFRCTVELKELMLANDALVAEAVKYIPPQTTKFTRRVARALGRKHEGEIADFVDNVDRRAASYVPTRPT
ncbi:hypothetical protein [Rhodococcoides kroppenstedtii]|uniref:hypothetical protein n=1 Tax=Rhodococcoides kroppenstedtii TaxID=293050 RepID=UPI0028E3D320|nr:hypothetical protein [Rhodococcus kroppenstedtii]